MSKERNIIVHYHLFKNAGSSVDQLLKKNFQEKWSAFDGSTPGSVITTRELEDRINSEPDSIAFSSHQIVPPLPQIEANVYPIVFIRDPIDRIKSAYLFEWKKQLGLDEPKGSFTEFVQEKFKYKRKSSIEEFQTIRLSNCDRNDFHLNEMQDEEMLEKACGFIDKLEFVGVVDEFEKSKKLLSAYLGTAFPYFETSNVKANVLQDLSLSQDTKRQAIKEELGDELFESIVSRSVLDEALYQHSRKRLGELYQNVFSMEEAKAG